MCTIVGLGIKSRGYNLTHKYLLLVLLPDSSAAIGIGSRRGAGKVRHIDTSTIWLQAHVTSKNIELQKTPGETNVSDLGTKHLAGPRMIELMRLLGLHPKAGRHPLALSAWRADNIAPPVQPPDESGKGYR